MKILYLSLPGFADSDFPLVRSLQKKGVDITYVMDLIPSSKKTTIVNINDSFQVDGLIKADCYTDLNIFKSYLDFDSFYILNRTKDRRLSNSGIKAVIALIRFIKEEKFDIIHSTFTFWYWDMLLYLFRNKMILTVHDPFPHTGENSFRKIIFKNIAFKAIKSFVLLNSAQKNKFETTYSISPLNVLISRFGPFDYLKLFSEEDNNTPNNILFFGRISPYKGVEYLCEAFLQVNKVIKNATLTIAGGGNIYFDFSRYSNNPQITLINRFLDIAEIAKLVGNSTIVVCPYTDATQSGVITTAFSLIKPVIASNVGGLGEMVIDKVTGLLVEPKNTSQLAEAIIQVLSSDILLFHLKKGIIEKFYEGANSWDNISNEYIQYYKSKSNCNTNV